MSTHVSFSRLNALNKGVSAYYKYLADKRENKTTKAKEFGVALHQYILDRGNFDKNSFSKYLPDIMSMASALKKYKPYMRFFDPSKTQNEQKLTMIYKDVEVLSYVDQFHFLAKGAVFINDIKTTTDISDENISKTIIDYALHMQSAIYKKQIEKNFNCDGLDFYNFLTFISKDESPRVRMIMLDTEDIAEGGVLFDALINKYKALDTLSSDDNEYIGNMPKPFKLPYYKFNKYDKTINQWL